MMSSTDDDDDELLQSSAQFDACGGESLPLPQLASFEVAPAAPAPTGEPSAGPAGGCIRLDNTKAGMAAVDRGRVEDVINALSVGSPFYANEQRKAAARQRRITALLARDAEFRGAAPATRSAATAAVAAIEAAQDAAARPLGVFVHIDMDSFFAQAEERENPALRSVPMAVGGESMLSTSNYAARAFGVRAGMPGYIARKLCPSLVIVRSTFGLYTAIAEQVRAIAAEYDPRFVSHGIDELRMDASTWIAAERQRRQQQQLLQESGGEKTCVDDNNYGAMATPDAIPPSWLALGAELAALVRRRIAEVTQLTASAGIATTGTLAKIASNVNKPNGQCLVPAATRAAVAAHVAGLAVRQIPGIGRASEEALRALGLATMGDVYAARHRLFHVFTPKTFAWLLASSRGIRCDASGGSDSPEESAGEGGGACGAAGRAASHRRQSVSNERTFGRLDSRAAFTALARRLSDLGAATLVEERLVAGTVTVKLKATSFLVRQHSARVAPGPATSDAAALWAVVASLLDTHVALDGDNGHASLRLLGVRFGDLAPPTRAAAATAGAAAVGARGAPAQPTLALWLPGGARARAAGGGAIDVDAAAPPHAFGRPRRRRSPGPEPLRPAARRGDSSTPVLAIDDESDPDGSGADAEVVVVD